MAAFTTTLHASRLPAPMPEFLSQEQLVKWQADRIAAAESKKTAAREQAAIQFYTGKPFDSSSGSYLFKYRSYDPEFSRWTSADPSGFPDGANNQHYSPNPFSEFDWQGLETKTISRGVPLTLESLTISTGIETTITASWNSQPTMNTVRWADSSQTAGSKTMKITGNDLTTSWQAQDRELVITNIQVGNSFTIDGSTFKTYTFNATYALSYSVTFSGETNVGFTLFGVDLSTGASGSTTMNYNRSISSQESITVKE